MRMRPYLTILAVALSGCFAPNGAGEGADDGSSTGAVATTSGGETTSGASDPATGASDPATGASDPATGGVTSGGTASDSSDGTDPTGEPTESDGDTTTSSSSGADEESTSSTTGNGDCVGVFGRARFGEACFG